MADHVATVASIYEAFGRGDVPSILGALSEDVRWEEWADNQTQASGVPWPPAGRGNAGALGVLPIPAGFKTP